MEKHLEKLESLVNLLSKKEVYIIECVGKCNSDGQIIQTFQDGFNLRDDISYTVSLLSLNSTAFFPNLTESNNRFYYSEAGSTAVKEFKLLEGAYEIHQYNETIKSLLGDKKDSINIMLHPMTGRVEITLAEGWKIYFDREGTWRDILGFNSSVLDKKSNMSDKMANVLTFSRIYVNCDIIKGAYFNGQQSTQLWSFDNAYRYGAVLAFTINPKQETLLVTRTFNRITFTFLDENNKPVTFGNAQTTIKIEVKQF